MVRSGIGGRRRRLTLEAIRRVLATNEPTGTRGPAQPFDPPCAAVALALAGPASDLHLALILRAEREGDPWSGQMALPGGRAGPSDAGAADAAERETHEELGIRLSSESLLGALEDQPVRRASGEVGMWLYPFVYYLGTERPQLRPNREVARTYWVPLLALADPARARRHRFVRDGQEYDFPAIAIEDQLIWGLTYRVLSEFFAKLGVRLPE